MNYRPTNGPVAKEAFPFVLGVFTAAIVSFLLGWTPLTVIFVFLGIFILAFFRNPERYFKKQPQKGILAGADGKIVAAGIVPHEDFPDGQCLRVAIFMNVFNCHINWSPFKGVVESAEYYPGQFLNAMEDKCAEHNERKIINLRTEDGQLIVVKLIAGLVARRIVCPIEAGDELEKGEKIGLIRFGSRVEILLPANSELHVRPGMIVTGSETVVAVLPE